MKQKNLPSLRYKSSKNDIPFNNVLEWLYFKRLRRGFYSDCDGIRVVLFGKLKVKQYIYKLTSIYKTDKEGWICNVCAPKNSPSELSCASLCFLIACEGRKEREGEKEREDKDNG